MRTRTICRIVGIGLLLGLWASSVQAAQPLEVYGAWHCGNDYCTWSTVRDMSDFDAKNRWLIDRGDGLPSVNLVVLEFRAPAEAAEPDDRCDDAERRAARHDAGNRQVLH